MGKANEKILGKPGLCIIKEMSNRSVLQEQTPVCEEDRERPSDFK